MALFLRFSSPQKRAAEIARHVGMLITALATVAAVAMLATMIVVTIRIGPKAGKWNQPAAALRSPAAWVAITVVALGALHLVALVMVVARMDAVDTGTRVMLILVGVATLGMYMLMGLAGPLAGQLIRARDWRAARRASQPA